MQGLVGSRVQAVVLAQGEAGSLVKVKLAYASNSFWRRKKTIVSFSGFRCRDWLVATQEAELVSNALISPQTFRRLRQKSPSRPAWVTAHMCGGRTARATLRLGDLVRAVRPDWKGEATLRLTLGGSTADGGPLKVDLRKGGQQGEGGAVRLSQALKRNPGLLPLGGDTGVEGLPRSSSRGELMGREGLPPCSGRGELCGDGGAAQQDPSGGSGQVREEDPHTLSRGSGPEAPALHRPLLPPCIRRPRKTSSPAAPDAPQTPPRCDRTRRGPCRKRAQRRRRRSAPAGGPRRQKHRRPRVSGAPPRPAAAPEGRGEGGGWRRALLVGLCYGGLAGALGASLWLVDWLFPEPLG